jgi:hypothetical protein
MRAFFKPVIGATREAVARTLGEWREMGIIATGRRTTVLERDGLQHLAAGVDSGQIADRPR